MLAAYTFKSAVELSEFCARHDIGGRETYTVLQSAVAGTFDREYSLDLRLTLVLDLMPRVLGRIKQDESDYQKAYREQLRREEESYEVPQPADGTGAGSGSAQEDGQEDMIIGDCMFCAQPIYASRPFCPCRD